MHYQAFTSKTKWITGIAVSMEQKTQSNTTLIDDLKELPPSAKLVFKVLQKEGDLTQSEIKDESLLASRTVRYAVLRLENQGLISSKISLRDARKNIYSIDPEFQPATGDQTL